MKRAILFFCATLMLALGFSSCSDDPTRTWTKAEVEEMAKEAASSVYFDLNNPNFNCVDDVVIAYDAYQNALSIDSTFYSLPISTLKRVADVCINRNGQTDKKDIVREYLKHISVYTNMSEKIPTASSNDDNKSATDSGGSDVTKDDGSKVFETSFNYYTDTVDGKPVKVEVKTTKSYVKP